MNTLRLGLILVLVAFLSGCGVTLFVPPEEDAVVDEHVFTPIIDLPRFFGWDRDSVHALSTKAERRLVLMEKKKVKNGYHGKSVLTVCAESPAEATQDLSSTFDFAGTVEKIEISKLLKALSTKVKPTFKRSQGLQFYRDGAFQLCQAYLNGLITEKTLAHGFHPCPHCFITQLNELRDIAERIILHEVANGFYKDSDDEDEKTETKTETESTTETTSKTTQETVVTEETE